MGNSFIRNSLCAMFFLLMAYIPAHAGQQLVVGVDDRDWSGHYQWVNGELIGIDADIIRGVAKNLDYEVVFKSLPWARLLAMGEDKTIDIILDLAPTAQRGKYLYYVETPITVEATVFWVKKGSSFHYSGKFDPNMRLGLIYASDWSDRFTREGTPTVEVFHSYKAAFSSLIEGRIDAFGGYLLPTQDQVRQLGIVDEVEPSLPILYGLPYYIAFTDKEMHGKLAQKFSDALKAFYESAEYKKLLIWHDGVDMRPFLHSK